jgi:hypothetical protein
LLTPAGVTPEHPRGRREAAVLGRSHERHQVLQVRLAAGIPHGLIPDEG